MPTPMIAEDVITIPRLREFLAGCDNRYADPSDIKTYGLSINDHTISIVENGQNNSVTVPDSDTTYSLLTKGTVENTSSTTPGLISGQRMMQSISSFLKTATWNDIEQYTKETVVHIPESE